MTSAEFYVIAIEAIERHKKLMAKIKKRILFGFISWASVIIFSEICVFNIQLWLGVPLLITLGASALLFFILLIVSLVES